MVVMKKILLLISILFSGIDCSILPAKTNLQFKQKEVSAKIAKVEVNLEPNFKMIREELYNICKSNSYHGLLLEINNTGGAVTDFSPLYDLIMQIKTRIPVVVFVSGHAASAGYLLASAADKIVCCSLPVLGSIGVLMNVNKLKEAEQVCTQTGCKYNTEWFIGGDYKGLFLDSSGPLNDEQRKHVQERINYLYNNFVETVAKNRNLDVKEHKKWANGRCFDTAKEAKELCLIDIIGTLIDAENVLNDLIQVKNQDVKFISA